MELADISGIAYQVIYSDTGRYLREHRSDQGVQSLEIGFLGFLKRLRNDLTLALGTRVVGIHETKTSVRYRLNTV